MADRLARCTGTDTVSRCVAGPLSSSLRIGIASQTPLARLMRPLDEIERERGPLPSPLPLEMLERSVDYSVTPGGVARMVQAAIVQSEGLAGEWVALDNGVGRDLRLGGFLLTGARLPAEAAAGYGRFKEVVWEALNGLLPRIDDPASADPAIASDREDFRTWSVAAAERLARSRFDVHYVNDWQLLGAARHLPASPSVLHLHAPFADWTPAPWKGFVLEGLRDFDAVIVSTREYAEALRKAGLECPVHVLAPWIAPADVRPPSRAARDEFARRFGIRATDEVILHVARMDPIKGQDVLIGALANLLAARPRAKLVLVGNGSFSSSKRGGIGLSKGKRWRARLEALVESLGVADRVVFTGHLPHEEVLAALDRCDVFAFPSVAEGFGLAPIEAWLAEKPVVVSRGAGMSEHVREGENGWVVDGGDRAWAKRIEAVLADRDAALRAGQAGRATAIEVCDVRARAPELLRILERTARAARRPDRLKAAAKRT